MAFMECVGLWAAVIGMMYFRASALIWVPVLGILLYLASAYGHVDFIFLCVSWLIYLPAAVISLVAPLRRRLIVKPLLKKLEDALPSISRTEREAIEAGDVWWEKELFCGKPDWNKLHAIPKPTLTKEEQSFLDHQVEKLCGMVNDWNVVFKDYDMPKAAWDFLKKERFFGMVIPKEYGGLGFSALAHSTVVLKIATRCISAAVNTMVPNSLGPAELLLHYGTKAQKDYYLPRLAQGEEMPCFALTAPQAGSDAGSITDSGVVCRGTYKGKEVLGIRLNWDKRYITLAPVATLLGVAIRLYDPEQLLGKKEDVGITLCLVPTNTTGVEIGHRHWPMHMSFMNGPTRGKDVFLPIDCIIGGENMAGQGWRMLMENLSIGRSISLPALSMACGKFVYRVTGAYSRVRRQFKTAISQFEGVEEALAKIAGMTYQMEATRIMTAGAVDLNIHPAIASAITKYQMTEMARKVISHGMDIHAGQGIQLGPRNFLAMPHMSIPISITVEGANILTRNLIIFGQGAIRCHPYILKEIQLLSANDVPQRLKELDTTLMSHIGYALNNFARAFLFGLTGGLFIKSPIAGPTARYYKQLTRMSAAIAFVADISMITLGGKLKRKERISARLGDVLSELYMASAVLKYFQDLQQPQTDLANVRWALKTSLHNIQKAFDEVLYNFPIKWLGLLMSWVIFPFGSVYRKPSDKLEHTMTNYMLNPSEFRDRMTQYMYLPTQENEPIRRLETALAELSEIDPLMKKIQQAVKEGSVPKSGDYAERLKAALKAKVITKSEMSTLLEYDALQNEVITVDEFSFDFSKVIK